MFDSSEDERALIALEVSILKPMFTGHFLVVSVHTTSPQNTESKDAVEGICITVLEIMKGS